MATNILYKKLSNAREEKDVDNAYAEAFMKAYKIDVIEHPFKCDGYIEDIFKKLIIEYKYDEDFSLPTAKSKVLLQVLFYLKQFELGGREIPSTIFIGDKNECFLVHSNSIINYLDKDIDWSIAPSMAAATYPELVLEMAVDKSINPFVYDITPDFKFSDVISRITDLSENVERFVRVTEHNLSNNFDSFVSKVIKSPSKLSPNELVAIYIGSMMDKENYYQHPSNPNILVAADKKIDIDGRNFASFFSHFNRDYTPQELNRFTEIADRLIEDTKRRRSGEFYTPTPFVDYAHRMIESLLGEGWRENYVVWDNCWGTGNLTRDYRFKELYASTLEPSELAIGNRYNRESTKFIFDFLNSPIEGDLMLSGVPDGLMQALKQNRPIVFFLNPPYANNTGDGKLAGTSEKVCYTMVRDAMNNVGLDACVANLYAQFMYRIQMLKQQFNLTNVYIGIFSPTLFLTGISWKGFRNTFLNNFKFEKAVVFKASNFADVSGSWGISFSLWSNGETIDKNSFDYGLIDNVDGTIREIGRKTLYNIDNAKTASEWVREDTKNLKTHDSINLTSAIKVREKDGQRKGMISDNALGYFYNAGNNVDKNVSHIAMFSAACSLGIGNSVIPENFGKCASLFAARKLISKDWVNSKDEYLAPNIEDPRWTEFVNDSIIFSTFHTSGNQSSLRNVVYKGKTYNIKNEFFYMSKYEVMDLLAQNGLNNSYEDARTDSERFEYVYLSRQTLSKEAASVLDKAIELTKSTFKYRQLFDMEHPEYQIKNWDCGWYQIKAMIKAYMPAELDAFNKLFKALSDKMRPMVYELGFLKS